jgi:hypothetical protein
MDSRPYCGNCVAIRFDSVAAVDRLLQVDKTKPGDNFFYVNMPQVQGSALQVHSPPYRRSVPRSALHYLWTLGTRTYYSERKASHFWCQSNRLVDFAFGQIVFEDPDTPTAEQDCQALLRQAEPCRAALTRTGPQRCRQL